MYEYIGYIALYDNNVLCILVPRMANRLQEVAQIAVASGVSKVS